MLVGYDDVELIGEGGLGKVYRARRVSTGGLVAIKELRDVEEASPAWHRARRELEAMLRLKGHPNVVSVEEVAQGPNGPCLVMEYAPNGSLIQRMERNRFTGPELVLIGQQVCDALMAAHQLGIVHRDIKPHNLLVGAFGRVKVCDFGIAQLARQGEVKTKTSAITMAYASPEELDGVGDIGPEADVYSFGATMIHLITGQRPTFKNRMDTATIDLSGWERELRPVLGMLRHSMAHDPIDRPTIEDLAAAFDEASILLGTEKVRSLNVAADVGPSSEDNTDVTVVRRAAASSFPAPIAAVPAFPEGRPWTAEGSRESPTVVRRSPAISSAEVLHDTAANESSRGSKRTFAVIAASIIVLSGIGVVFAMKGGSENVSASVSPQLVTETVATAPSVESTAAPSTATPTIATSSTIGAESTTVTASAPPISTVAPAALPVPVGRKLSPTGTTALTTPALGTPAPTTPTPGTPAPTVATVGTPAPTTTVVTSTTAKPTTTTAAPSFVITTSKGPAGASCGGFNCVNVSGSGFLPNVALTIYCGLFGGSFVGPYSLGSTDATGSFPTRTSVCWHASGAINNQDIKVTDGTHTAQVVSAW